MTEKPVHADHAAPDPLARQRTLGAVEVGSLADTDRLAGCLHQHLSPRCCLGLVGTLGAGKTRLVQGLARAAGIDPAGVTSPTFTLVQQYQGDRLLYHLDAYRLADEDEFWELGVEELFQQQALTVVEWADRVAASMPAATLWVQLALAGQSQRRSVRFAGDPQLWQSVVQHVAADYAADRADEDGPAETSGP